MEQNNQTQPPVFNQPSVQQPAQQYQPQVTAIPMMNPIEAITACFKKLFNFKGRARRSEFWWFMLFVLVLSLVFAWLSGWVPALSYVWLPISLILMIGELSALTRRLHDTSRSGWWVVALAVCLLLYYGSLAILLIPIGFENMLSITDTMEMGSLLVTSIQDHPIIATVMTSASLLAIVLIVVLIVFAVLDSKWGENKYGPSPKYK